MAMLSADVSIRRVGLPQSYEPQIPLQNQEEKECGVTHVAMVYGWIKGWRGLVLLVQCRVVTALHGTVF
jgi:hypothetical protein